MSAEYPVVSAEHALIVGLAWGAAVKAGLPVEMLVDEAGGLQAAFRIVLPEKIGEIEMVTVAVPPPT